MLTEEYIRNNVNKVDWMDISWHQALSEDLIEEFRNKVDWYGISRYQVLSKSFIEKFKNKIIIKMQLRKHHNKLSKEEKITLVRNYAKKYNLKYDSEYLYAYRKHDKFGRGMYSNYIYKKGIYKDWHCDLDPMSKNSFGLGILPEGNIPVRIKIKNIGCWVNNSDKLRVWEFEIL